MAGRFPLIAHFLGRARKYFFAPVFGPGSRGWLVPTEPMVGWNSARNLIKNFISSNRFLESTACGIEIVWDRGVFRINDGIENLSLSLSSLPFHETLVKWDFWFSIHSRIVTRVSDKSGRSRPRLRSRDFHIWPADIPKADIEFPRLAFSFALRLSNLRPFNGWPLEKTVHVSVRVFNSPDLERPITKKLWH